MKRKTIEEYIEIIFVLEQTEQRAHTGRIAAEMGVKPPSVTQILRKLEREGLVRHEPYGGATLTPAGEAIAEALMARHRIIADFLEIIGVDRDRAELDACQIEHYVAGQTVERLAKFVEFVKSAPRDPRWMEHFRHFCNTGQRIDCKSPASEG